MSKAFCIAFLIAIFNCATVMSATVPFVPEGLNPGDEYHLLFFTRDGIDGTSGDIDDYNHFVQEQAVLSGAVTAMWEIIWSAVVGTQDIGARENAVVSAPIYTLSGDLAFTGFDDVWDLSTPALPSQTDQFGTMADQEFLAWAGALIIDDVFADIGMGTPAPLGFLVTHPEQRLLFESGLLASSELPVYAFSEVLTVVPEPSGFLIGVLCFAFASTRRQRSLQLENKRDMIKSK